MPTQIKDKQKIIFIGDSITDCGRLENASPLGNGYVKMFADMITTREPGKKIQILNRGISGHTVEDLRNRWYEDVLTHSPDWLSVKIGINDIHRYLFEGNFEFLSPQGYEKIYDQLLELTKDKLPNCQILLIDPFFISMDFTNDNYRTKVLNIIPEYIDVVHRLSEKYQTHLVKMHDVFQNQLKYQHPDRYCDEPVHPNSAGHLLIAEAVYIISSKSHDQFKTQ